MRRDIVFSPGWPEIKPQGYYVYRHYRKSDGTLFYVGKGLGRRAWDKTQRNKWWVNIAKKHGVIVEIVKQGMSQHCSLTLERIAIHHARMSGHDLCNISDGGDGSLGVPSVNRKTVYCSNGMVFESTSHAARWVSEEYGVSSCFSAVASAASGVRYSAYGLSWSYDKDIPEYIDPSSRKRSAFSISVITDIGEEFSSITNAQDWLRENGFPSASSSKISLCINGKRKRAYGRAWRRKE